MLLVVVVECITVNLTRVQWSNNSNTKPVSFRMPPEMHLWVKVVLTSQEMIISLIKMIKLIIINDPQLLREPSITITKIIIITNQLKPKKNLH